MSCSAESLHQRMEPRRRRSRWRSRPLHPDHVRTHARVRDLVPHHLRSKARRVRMPGPAALRSPWTAAKVLKAVSSRIRSSEVSASRNASKKDGGTTATSMGKVSMIHTGMSSDSCRSSWTWRRSGLMLARATATVAAVRAARAEAAVVGAGPAVEDGVVVGDIDVGTETGGGGTDGGAGGRSGEGLARGRESAERQNLIQTQVMPARILPASPRTKTPKATRKVSAVRTSNKLPKKQPPKLLKRHSRKLGRPSKMR